MDKIDPCLIRIIRVNPRFLKLNNSKTQNLNMTFEEMLQQASSVNTRRRHKDEEHRLQCSCVQWFRLQYPRLKNLLFAVPNGGSRNKAEAARMKDEGVTAGVADLILLTPNRFYGALCIEMKAAKGRQSDTQKQWQQEAEANGAKYVVCRSLDDFRRHINEYLDKKNE